jgi:hypothetical protein
MRLVQNSCGFKEELCAWFKIRAALRLAFADSCMSDRGFVIVLVLLDASPNFIARGWEYIWESSGLL